MLLIISKERKIERKGGRETKRRGRIWGVRGDSDRSMGNKWVDIIEADLMTHGSICSYLSPSKFQTYLS